MALYTIVDEAYEVTGTSAPRFLDSYGDVDFNQRTFKAQLLKEGASRVYIEDASDWAVKVQVHK